MLQLHLKLSRWIIQSTSLAYKLTGRTLPEYLKAHSSRALSTSAAFHRRVELPLICCAAPWSTPSTFVKHYHLDIRAKNDAAFGLPSTVTSHHPVSELASHPIVCIHRDHEEERLPTCNHGSLSGPLWIHTSRPSSPLFITLSSLNRSLTAADSFRNWGDFGWAEHTLHGGTSH